jgi:hypothetical protein
MCHLGPYTLKMHIWFLKLRFGCHLGPHTLKMQILLPKLGFGCYVVPQTLEMPCSSTNRICYISNLQVGYYFYWYIRT